MTVTNSGPTSPNSYRKKLIQTVKKKTLSLKKILSYFSGRRLVKAESLDKNLPPSETPPTSRKNILTTRKTSLPSSELDITGAYPLKQEEIKSKTDDLNLFRPLNAKNEQDAFEEMQKNAQPLNVDLHKGRPKPPQKRKPPARWQQAVTQKAFETQKPTTPEIRESTETYTPSQPNTHPTSTTDVESPASSKPQAPNPATSKHLEALPTLPPLSVDTEDAKGSTLKNLDPPAIPPKPNRAQSIDSKPSDPIS